MVWYFEVNYLTNEQHLLPILIYYMSCCLTDILIIDLMEDSQQIACYIILEISIIYSDICWKKNVFHIECMFDELLIVTRRLISHNQVQVLRKNPWPFPYNSVASMSILNDQSMIEYSLLQETSVIFYVMWNILIRPWPITLLLVFSSRNFS